MRPQVGKRSSLNDSTITEEVNKTKSRLYVEKKTRHNLSIGKDYLIIDDVATAININALEQRILTKKKIISLLKKGIAQDKLISMLENDMETDRHRLVKMGFGSLK